jgi:hypothetical protein
LQVVILVGKLHVLGFPILELVLLNVVQVTDGVAHYPFAEQQLICFPCQFDDAFLQPANLALGSDEQDNQLITFLMSEPSLTLDQ